MAALGVVAELWRDGAHEVADKAQTLSSPCAWNRRGCMSAQPVGFAGRRVLADQAGVPDHVGRLVRWHEDGFVELQLAGRGLDLLVERVHLLHAGVGHMGDDVGVQLLEGLLVAHADGGDLGLGIEDHDLAGDLVLLDVRGDQAGALVGRGWAAVRAVAAASTSDAALLESFTRCLRPNIC